MDQGRLELPTSRLSSVRSNQLSYTPREGSRPFFATPAFARASAGTPSSNDLRWLATRSSESKWWWAWVDLNYRPHAYQAPIKRAKSRHFAVLFTGRTHDLPFLRQNMPESAGISRPNDRPNRHRNRPEGRVATREAEPGRARSRPSLALESATFHPIASSQYMSSTCI